VRTRSQTLRKEEVLSHLIETRERILAAASGLPAAGQSQVFLGTWSIRDLLAHLIGWDATNLEAARSLLLGSLPSFYQYRDRDWQSYNGMLVKEYNRGSFEELLARAGESQKKLIEFLRAIPAEQFGKDFGVRFRGYKVTIRRLLESEWKDEQAHLQQIVDFVQKAE